MKTYRTGTHRTVSPEETLNKIQPHLAAMGITRLANVTGLDDIGIPVITACRPNAKAVAVSQGKGISVAAAKASAAMEAIETYHAEHIDLPMRFTNFTELSKSHTVVDVTQVPRMNVMPFSAATRRPWIQGRELEGGELESGAEIYVPYDLVHCDFTVPLPPGSGCFQLSTNGLASDNTREEATSHALCDLIERDAMTLWSLLSKHQQAKQLSFNKMWHDNNWVDANIKKVDEFDYSFIDILAQFKGTHPQIMQKRINNVNWSFSFDPTKNSLSLKSKILHFIEQKLNYQFGEYKNYKLI